MRTRRRGLTLTELLIAMAIFALGGSAIVSLFLVNARLSLQAINLTRAAEISRNVRSFLTVSLGRPISLPDGSAPIYRFDYAGSSLQFSPSKYLLEREQNNNPQPLSAQEFEAYAGLAEDNAVYFRLPTELFNATLTEQERADLMVDLPGEALSASGGPRFNASNSPEVFRLLPDNMRGSAIMRGYDPDERMFFSFDFSLRRSNLRSSLITPDGAGGTQPLSDLFVCHLRVYRGFDFASDNAGQAAENDPIFETSFHVTANR